MEKQTQLAHIQKLLTALIDLFFPPAKEEMLLRGATSLGSLYEPSIFNKVRYLCHYNEKIIRSAVKENKFHNNRNGARVLGRLLEKWAISQPSSTIYIPIPLGKKRQRQRGHNQVESILNAVTTPISINTRIIDRQVETIPQTKLDRGSRSENIKDVFKFTGTNIDLSKYTQMVLVDDVVTTGATLNEARATLAPHLPPNIKLVCLAIAH